MNEDDILADYCVKNGFDFALARKLYCKYKNINKIINTYITSKLTEEKDYLNNILKVVVTAISLDEDQRKVVISDEDYSLVIARAEDSDIIVTSQAKIV